MKLAAWLWLIAFERIHGEWRPDYARSVRPGACWHTDHRTHHQGRGRRRRRRMRRSQYTVTQAIEALTNTHNVMELAIATRHFPCLAAVLARAPEQALALAYGPRQAANVESMIRRALGIPHTFEGEAAPTAADRLARFHGRRPPHQMPAASAPASARAAELAQGDEPGADPYEDLLKELDDLPDPVDAEEDEP